MTLGPALALLLALIPVGDERPPAGDLGRLQGAWRAVVGPDKGAPIVLEIRGSTCVVRSTNGEGEVVATRAELTLDETTDPRTWDARRRTGDDGRAMPDLKGLYRIESDGRGDLLRLVNNGPGKPRPTSFEPSPEGLPVVTLFRRMPRPTPQDR